MTYVSNLMLFVELGYLKDLCALWTETKHVQNSATNIEAKVFASLLSADNEELKKGNDKCELSLAGKWAPRQKSKYNDFANEIIREMGYAIEDVNARSRMYRKMCSALNEKLNTLEVLMTAKKYDDIAIEKIPANALKRTRKAIERHMLEKYTDYLTRCRTGEVKIKTTGIQPHELCRKIISGGDQEMAELQLEEIIRKLRESGVFDNTLAVSDVSGSMHGIPMDVSIAIGYIVSQLQNEHFKDQIITFSADPVLHKLVGETTREKLHSLQRAPWGMNTNFIKVFDLLLREAQKNGITEENMVKKIIVFTDMQFDQAQSGRAVYQTAYEEIQGKYRAADFELPQIIFWNLRQTTVSFPVTKDTPGVALMNGFSAEMLKIFMEGGDMSPYSMMVKAVNDYPVTVVEGEEMPEGI